MALKREVIRVPKGAIEKLMFDQKAGKSTVYEALAGNRHNENAKRIRQLALSKYGGIKTVMPV